LLKNIVAYCGYSPTSVFFLLLSEHTHCDNMATNSKSKTPTSVFFLLLSEHTHCDNMATNSKSKNARSRMVTSLLGSMGTGTREVKYWACLGCWISQCYTPFWLGVRFGPYEPFISLIFHIFFGWW